MKRFSLIIGIALLLCVLSSCDEPFASFNNRHALGRQYNTSWVSEDGNITLNILDEKSYFSEVLLTVGDEEIFGCYISPCLYRKEDVVEKIEDGKKRIYFTKEPIESWSVSLVFNDSFTITVNEHTSYFEAGQKIKFYKVTE